MRVLLVNKFYYPRGGDCMVVLNTEAMLRECGVEAEVFAMQYPENLPSRFKNRFASEVNFGGGVGNKLRALRRTLGKDDVQQRFEAVLDEFQPDVVHLHNIHSYLSPVVGQLAHRRGIRVLHRRQAGCAHPPLHEGLAARQRRGMDGGHQVEPPRSGAKHRPVCLPQPIHGRQDEEGWL